MIEHVSDTQQLLVSARSCSFCAMIRDAIVVEYHCHLHIEWGSRENPIQQISADLIPNQSRNHEFFRTRGYAEAPVYLHLHFSIPHGDVLTEIHVLVVPEAVLLLRRVTDYLAAQAQPVIFRSSTSSTVFIDRVTDSRRYASLSCESRRVATIAVQ